MNKFNVYSTCPCDPDKSGTALIGASSADEANIFIYLFNADRSNEYGFTLRTVDESSSIEAVSAEARGILFIDIH